MDKIAYKPLPLDAMAGTSRDLYATPLDGLQSYTSTDTGAPPIMRFKLENAGLLDPDFIYLGATFTVNYSGGTSGTTLADAANVGGLNVTSKATTGGILCPQAVESIIERVETRAGGNSIDVIPSKFSLLQSMLNAAMPETRAKNFGGVLGMGNFEDRLIPFSRTAGEPISAGWQGRELLIPLHATLFANPRSGLIPAKFIRGGLEVYLTFAQPSDILGQIAPTDADGVATGASAVNISFTLTQPRLYYRTMATAADEAWTAKLRAGGSIPYPITRYGVTTNTIPKGRQGTWSWNTAIQGTDCRAIIFAFQVQGMRGTGNPWCWSDNSTFPYHSSMYSNSNTYGALRNVSGDVIGPAPILAGIRSAQLFVNDAPVPAYGPAIFNSTTVVPSGAWSFLEWQKVAAIISDSQEFGSSVTTYRQWIDSDYCSTRKLPTTTNVVSASGANGVYTRDPAVGGDYKPDTVPHSFYLGFSLSSDPMHDDDRSGLGMASDTDGKMVRLELTFQGMENLLPLGGDPVYDEVLGPYQGDIVVTCFSVRKSCLLITEDTTTVTDKIVLA